MPAAPAQDRQQTPGQAGHAHGVARVTLRLDLAPNRRIGPGEIALLESIATTGSISAAGRALGISYRRAWLLVDGLNRSFAEPLAVTQFGGRQGGGTGLTERGRELIHRYRELECAVQALAAGHLDILAKQVAAPPALQA